VVRSTLTREWSHRRSSTPKSTLLKFRDTSTISRTFQRRGSAIARALHTKGVDSSLFIPLLQAQTSSLHKKSSLHVSLQSPVCSLRTGLTFRERNVQFNPKVSYQQMCSTAISSTKISCLFLPACSSPGTVNHGFARLSLAGL